jgi:L-lysine 2,3-aminomutase
MIPVSTHRRHPGPAGWQRALQDAITDPRELIAVLDLGPEWLDGALAAAERFPLQVPRGFVARMRRGDPHDPLLRQVLPLDAELRDTPGYSADPVGDLAARTASGVLHKYQGRALLITTGACAVMCRYCFRREFPYDSENAGRGNFAEAVARLRGDPSITEVLLSGGDPLTLNDRRLGGLFRELESIPHLRRIRLHTRLPVVLPERIDAGFLECWSSLQRLQKVVVIHANHAAELRAAPAVAAALRDLRATQTTLLNQSVLLRGVNDSVDALVELSEELFAHDVLPYYLHMLDPVRGAAHFDVPDDAARRLMAGLAARLPGYLVPKLVREVAGADSKTMLPPASR